MHSRNSSPGVVYLSCVCTGCVQSSKRTAYPTSSPSLVRVSEATRAATDEAATRRGCVQTTWRPSVAHPASRMYCGISV